MFEYLYYNHLSPIFTVHQFAGLIDFKINRVLPSNSESLNKEEQNAAIMMETMSHISKEEFESGLEISEINTPLMSTKHNRMNQKSVSPRFQNPVLFSRDLSNLRNSAKKFSNGPSTPQNVELFAKNKVLSKNYISNKKLKNFDSCEFDSDSPSNFLNSLNMVPESRQGLSKSINKLLSRKNVDEEEPISVCKTPRGRNEKVPPMLLRSSRGNGFASKPDSNNASSPTVKKNTDQVANISNMVIDSRKLSKAITTILDSYSNVRRINFRSNTFTCNPLKIFIDLFDEKKEVFTVDLRKNAFEMKIDANDSDIDFLQTMNIKILL